MNFANETSKRLLDNGSEVGSDNEKEVEVGDVDMDGDLDILIANGASDFGTKRNKLYLQNGVNTGIFTEVSGSVIIPEFDLVDVTRNGFIRDFTGDGWNDIYVINDSNTGGFGGSDHIYVAQHPGGVFSHFTEEGLSRIPSGGALGAACGGVAHDFDLADGIDVYSGNYPGPSQDKGLYNDGTGNFVDLTTTLIPFDSDYTVDVAAGDMNGDGKLDILVSNWDSSYIYYNDNLGAGTGLGDYRYLNSTQNIGNAAASENAMEPADFDNDGDLDIYWTNFVSGADDRILRNDGNDGGNKATFTDLGDILPESTSGSTSRKASVADFNDDGRIDVFVANQLSGRPGVLRNTTVDGVISFVDWSPAQAFPDAEMRGWHGAVFDSNLDGDIDILIGAFSDDHLIENVPANEVNEADISTGVLPALWNGDPVAVRGTGNAVDVDVYTVLGVGDGFVSVVLNGPHDYEFVIRQGNTVMATSDRGGVGVEEAVQLETTLSGNWSITVTVLANGVCEGDIDGDCSIGITELLDLLGQWGKTDVTDLLDLLGNWGEIETEYQLEVLGRDD